MVNHSVTLIGILLFITKCGADSGCCEKVSLYYLDAAVDLIRKAKDHFPASGNCESNLSQNALDCSETLQKGYKKNGVYKIWPQSRVAGDKPLEVYCDMETEGGGWTLIQRRGFFGKAEDYFDKDWNSYKEGFGDIDKDFWLGNDNIFALTNQKLYSARFDLKAVNDETRYAHYDTFWIDDEYNKYTLHIANYSGDAGDSLVARHSNQKFSAKGVDNDNLPVGNCVAKYRGGWWYNACYSANLNGLYINGVYDQGLHWTPWIKRNETLRATEIKIRPRNFKLPHADSNNTPM